MRRFYISPHSITGDLIHLSNQEARHISSVLRLSKGSPVEFFDGSGTIYTATLEQVSKNEVQARVLESRIDSPDHHAPLTLAQSLLKGKKMDFLVQKATELGVETFIPVTSRYCENKGQRQRQKERWQRIMIEACKQSQRSRPMEIMETTPLDQADFSSYSNRLVAWEQESTPPPREKLLQTEGANCLLIGPEGGLHSDEIEMLVAQGFTPFSLGNSILRAETAAIAATTLILYLSGALYGRCTN